MSTRSPSSLLRVVAACFLVVSTASHDYPEEQLVDGGSPLANSGAFKRMNRRLLDHHYAFFFSDIFDRAQLLASRVLAPAAGPMDSARDEKATATLTPPFGGEDVEECVQLRSPQNDVIEQLCFLPEQKNSLLLIVHLVEAGVPFEVTQDGIGFEAIPSGVSIEPLPPGVSLEDFAFTGTDAENED